MRYEVRAGYMRPLQIFALEIDAAAEWLLVRQNTDSGFWVVPDTGPRVGTREPGQFRQNTGGLFFHSCQDCQHDFFTHDSRIEPLCPGCSIAVRPAEPPGDGIEEWRYLRGRRWRARRLGVGEQFVKPDE